MCSARPRRYHAAISLGVLPAAGCLYRSRIAATKSAAKTRPAIPAAAGARNSRWTVRTNASPPGFEPASRATPTGAVSTGSSRLASPRSHDSREPGAGHDRLVNLLLAVVVIGAAAVLSAAALLLVRRHAPPAGFFVDGDRAAGVFGVLATGFSVLLGFVVFLAFTSYETAREGARSEATDVIQQFETAQLFPAAVRTR